MPQVIMKFPAFYGTGRFITTFTRARHFFLSSAWSKSVPSEVKSMATVFLDGGGVILVKFLPQVTTFNSLLCQNTKKSAWSPSLGLSHKKSGRIVACQWQCLSTLKWMHHRGHHKIWIDSVGAPTLQSSPCILRFGYLKDSLQSHQ
jgi:hypothetical protein